MIQTRIGRWLVALSLATYTSVGVLGYGLHQWLPCHDGACEDRHAAVDEGCCCCHEHHDVAAAEGAQDGATPRAGAKGHDAETCSLCALLAKINVGYAALELADDRTASSYLVADLGQRSLPADLILSFAARGPPTI